MLHEYRDDDETVAPAYAGRFDIAPPPKNRLPEEGAPGSAVYRAIHDELLLDGSSRLNLATFVTTWMEPAANMLMAEAFDKNAIDKDEYPQTAEIERRCVSMVAHLFHASEEAPAIGASTIGSSEAVMLGGLAMKWLWRARAAAAGRPTDRPNLVMGSNVQVVWEKFCRYWDVEPHYVNVKPGHYTVDPDDVMAQVDENTIGVVPILGTTHTGEFEPIKQIHDRVVAWNRAHDADVPIHVDAASGGFVAPFTHPDLEWDFRLPQVRSINVSGHKYGLTYPGIGFVVWRSEEFLPEDLVFHVNYLGGDMPTFTLNFSRPGNQIIGQYYNFLRLGRDGYRRVMKQLQTVAKHVASALADMDDFHVISDGSDLAVVAFETSPRTPYTVFDVSDELRQGGWQVPAYTMPPDAEDVAVLRIVVREGFSLDLADGLLEDLRTSVERLRRRPPAESSQRRAFAH
ncbi:MAG: glutamate decarboxylase [Nocardioides sp.]|nr:glutamate decarboxylase [Nocardioides sp.]